MTDETRPDDAKKLWQNQPLEGMTVSLEEVRERIETLGKKVRRRNLIGGSACLIVLMSSACFFVIFPNAIQRIGSVLTVIGAGYLMYQLVLGKLHKQGVAVLGRQTEASLAFYRSELQRQRDFHQGLWLWSRLLVFTPGPLIFFIGFGNAYPAVAKYIHVEAAIFAVLLIAAIPLNLRLARKYQRELDGLDSVSLT
jgi:hypothetical protein